MRLDEKSCFEIVMQKYDLINDFGIYTEEIEDVKEVLIDILWCKTIKDRYTFN